MPRKEGKGGLRASEALCPFSGPLAFPLALPWASWKSFQLAYTPLVDSRWESKKRSWPYLRQNAPFPIY